MTRRRRDCSVGDVLELLDHGAWTLAEACRVQARSRRLAKNVGDTMPPSGALRDRSSMSWSELRRRAMPLLLLRECPTIHRSYTEIAGTCDVCHCELRRRAVEYELRYSSVTLVLDGRCFAVLRNAFVAAAGSSSAAYADPLNPWHAGCWCPACRSAAAP